MRKAAWISVSIAALAFVGMVDASYVAIHSSQGFLLPCGIAGGCDQVLNSPYARVLGIPVAWFGLAFYLTTAGCALFALFGFEQALRLSFVLVSLALGFTVYLVLSAGPGHSGFLRLLLAVSAFGDFDFCAPSLVKTLPRSTGNLAMKKFLQVLRLLLCVVGFSVADHAVGTEFAVPGASAQQPQMTAATGRHALSRLWGGAQLFIVSCPAMEANRLGCRQLLKPREMLMLGRHRGPRVAATNDAVTITAIVGKTRGRTGWQPAGVALDGSWKDLGRTEGSE